jgi:hypothetical protein
MSFFLVFALQCLFPIFDLGAGEWVGLSVVNADSQAREYTVTATSPDGNTTQAGRLSLAPGEQRARLLGEILETAAPMGAGWIRIDSALSGCSSYIAAGNDTAFIGTDAPGVSGTQIVLPHVTVNTGFVELAHTDTDDAIVNSGSNPASITAQLFGLDGAARARAPFIVAARGSLVFKVSEVFREAMPANNPGGRTFSGYVRLASDVPIAAWQRVETPLTRSALRGRALGETPSTTSVVIPHFFFDGSYEAILNAVNPSGGPDFWEIHVQVKFTGT